MWISICSCVWLEAKIKSQRMGSILLNSCSTCVFVYSVITLSEKLLILNATKNVPKITFGMSLFHVKIQGQKIRDLGKVMPFLRCVITMCWSKSTDKTSPIHMLICSKSSLACYQESVFHVANVLTTYLHAVRPLQWAPLIQIEVNLINRYFT